MMVRKLKVQRNSRLARKKRCTWYHSGRTLSSNKRFKIVIKCPSEFKTSFNALSVYNSHSLHAEIQPSGKPASYDFGTGKLGHKNILIDRLLFEVFKCYFDFVLCCFLDYTN